jgi:predicted transcriptional regulator
MDIAQCVQIIKALADGSRLTLIQALREPQCVEELARRCNLAASTVCFHLGRLEEAGLVFKRKEQYYVVYALNEALFDKSLRELTSFRNAEHSLQESRLQRYREKVLRTFIRNGRINRIPAQHKKRLIVMEEILRRFHPESIYKESEVDGVIGEFWDDYCTIRRAFIDEGMMVRDGDKYRLVKSTPGASPLHVTMSKKQSRTTKVKTKQDIKREYKERKIPAGIFQVRNSENGKVLLGSSLNLEGPLNSHKFMLKIGRHRNETLQKEWNEYGQDKFIFEILEIVKVKEDPNFNLSDELTLLEQIWLEKLQPFGERGYNIGTHIRQA